jgi:hypothetical protein
MRKAKTTTVVERTSCQLGRCTSFISCRTLATNSGACLIDWTIPTPFIVGTYAFSIFSSDKRHSSFLDLTSCQHYTDETAICNNGCRNRCLVRNLCWRSAGKRGGKSRPGRGAEVFNIKPVAYDSWQEQEHKQDRQRERRLIETMPCAQCDSDG